MKKTNVFFLIFTIINIFQFGCTSYIEDFNKDINSGNTQAIDSTITNISILQTDNPIFYEKLPIPQEIEVTINSDFTYKVPFINSTVTGMPEDIKFSVESTGTNITIDGQPIDEFTFTIANSSTTYSVQVATESGTKNHTLTVELTGTDDMRLVPECTDGFEMGFDGVQYWNKPVHNTQGIDSFHMGAFEITYKRWYQVKENAIAIGYAFKNLGEKGVQVKMELLR